MSDETAPSQEVDLTAVPTEAPEVSGAINSEFAPPLLDILDNENTLKKARRVLQTKWKQFTSDREDLEDSWKDSDYMWSCGVDSTKRAADQTDDSDADTGSTLFYRQVRSLASLDLDVMFGRPGESPVRYKATSVENVPFSAEDARIVNAQRQALLKYSMKVDCFDKKYIEGSFMLTKYGNQPVMMWWKRRVDKRWIKTPKTDEAGEITGYDWERREVLVDDHPELVFPPNTNFLIDRHISDLQGQQAVFYETLKDITEIWGGATAGDYRNVETITAKDRYQGSMDSENESEDTHTSHEEQRGMDTGDDTGTGTFKVIHAWAKLPVDDDGEWDEKGSAPRWFLLSFVNNVETGPCLRAHENPDPDNEFPGFMWHRNPDDADLAYHIADSTVLKPNWDETTTRKNQYFDNLSTINRRPILNERGNANTNDLTYRQHAVINVENINGTKEMDVTDTSQSFQACLQYLDDDSNRAVGTDRPVTGEALGGRTSATEASNVNAAATRPHSVLIRYHMEQFLNWYARKVQRFWEIYGDPNRVLAVTDQKEMVRVDLGKIFGDFDTEVTIIQEFENDLVDNQNLAFVMQAVVPNFLDVLGVQGKLALLDKILKHYKVDTEDIIPEYTDVDAQLVAFERIRRMLDEGAYESPQPGENTAAHLRITEGILLQYGQSEDPTIQARLELVELYRQELTQLAATASAQQSVSQAAGPGNQTSGQVSGNALSATNPASNVGNLPIAG